MESLIGQLTDKQLEAVRGVADYKTAKEIARELNLTEHAIEGRLKQARANLGVQTSPEAARIYREEMARLSGVAPDDSPPCEETLGETVHGSSELSEAGPVGDQEPSPGTWDRSGDEPMTLHQPQAAYLGDWTDEATARSWKTILLEAGRENDLSPLARTVCMGGLAILAVVTMAVVVSLAEGLSRIF